MEIGTGLFAAIVIYFLFFSKDNQGCGCLLLILAILGVIILV